MVEYDKYVKISKPEKKVTNYEYLKSIDKDSFFEMVRRGVISVYIMDRITVYECFLHELKTNKKRVAITFTSEKYNLTERSIYKIIDYMQS